MYILVDAPENQVLSEIKEDGTFDWTWSGGYYFYNRPTIDPSDVKLHLFKTQQQAFDAIEEAKRQILLDDPDFSPNEFDFKVYKVIPHTCYTVHKEVVP